LLHVRAGIARALERNTTRQVTSLQRAYRASGECSWLKAPREEQDSGILARAWGVRPRSPGYSFFVNETLCGKRPLSAGGSTAGVELVGDRATSIGEQAGSNSFLPLCTVLGPARRSSPADRSQARADRDQTRADRSQAEADRDQKDADRRQDHAGKTGQPSGAKPGPLRLVQPKDSDSALNTPDEESGKKGAGKR
jgi:hypothetical protein